MVQTMQAVQTPSSVNNEAERAVVVVDDDDRSLQQLQDPGGKPALPSVPMSPTTTTSECSLSVDKNGSKSTSEEQDDERQPREERQHQLVHDVLHDAGFDSLEERRDAPEESGSIQEKAESEENPFMSLKLDFSNARETIRSLRSKKRDDDRSVAKSIRSLGPRRDDDGSVAKSILSLGSKKDDDGSVAKSIRSLRSKPDDVSEAKSIQSLRSKPDDRSIASASVASKRARMDKLKRVISSETNDDVSVGQASRISTANTAPPMMLDNSMKDAISDERDCRSVVSQASQNSKARSRGNRFSVKKLGRKLSLRTTQGQPDPLEIATSATEKTGDDEAANENRVGRPLETDERQETVVSSDTKADHTKETVSSKVFAATDEEGTWTKDKKESSVIDESGVADQAKMENETQDTAPVSTAMKVIETVLSAALPDDAAALPNDEATASLEATPSIEPAGSTPGTTNEAPQPTLVHDLPMEPSKELAGTEGGDRERVDQADKVAEPTEPAEGAPVLRVGVHSDPQPVPPDDRGGADPVNRDEPNAAGAEAEAGTTTPSYDNNNKAEEQGDGGLDVAGQGQGDSSKSPPPRRFVPTVKGILKMPKKPFQQEEKVTPSSAAKEKKGPEQGGGTPLVLVNDQAPLLDELNETGSEQEAMALAGRGCTY